MKENLMVDNMAFRSFSSDDWRTRLPQPICEDVPDYDKLYQKAWELSYDHIRYIDGMPQSPYMDEAFCDTQLWIWDTCFMSLFCKYASDDFPGVESLRNFYEVLYEGKSLPSIIPSEREPEWTGATPGVPFQIQIHIADNPPLFAFAEYENALFSGDVSYIRDLLYNKGVLQKHYDWIENLKESVLPSGVTAPTCLIAEEFGYKWEGGRSGMDNTPRGKTQARELKARPNNPNMLWIDAICQQTLSARIISKMFAIVGDDDNSFEWNCRYNEKKDIVNRYYWDDTDQFYYDIDINDHHFYKVMTPASYWALISEIATEERAHGMVLRLFDEETLGGEVPLKSLAKNDPDYDKRGRYWRGGLWLPTAYAALKGLEKYGYYDEARDLSIKILNHMLRTYTEYEPHTIWEAYAPEFSAPATVVEGNGDVMQDFCGWSALGPISLFIENVIGFHSVNAFEKVVKWQKPVEFKKALGIKNLRFADVVTDIVAVGNECSVKSNKPYRLEINGKAFQIFAGEQTISL